MTEEERNERMRPDYAKKTLNAALNMDGAAREISDDDDDDDFKPSSSTTKAKKRPLQENKGEKEKSSKARKFDDSFQPESEEDNDELPDLEDSPVVSGTETRSSCVTPEPPLPLEQTKMGAAPQLTPTQRKNLVIPPKGNALPAS